MEDLPQHGIARAQLHVLKSANLIEIVPSEFEFHKVWKN